MLFNHSDKKEKKSHLNRFWSMLAVSTLLASQLSFVSISAQTEESSEPSMSTLEGFDVNQLSPRNNLFQYANYAWILDHPLENDLENISVASNIDYRNQRLIEKDIKALVSGELEADTDELKEFVKFQKLLADSDRREQEGLAPISSELEMLEGITSLEKLNEQYANLVFAGYTLPLNLYVSTDMKDVSKNTLEVSEPRLYFETKDVYDDEELLKQETETFKINGVAILKAGGYSQEVAIQYVEDALAFDFALSKTLRSAEELAVSTNYYNPTSLDQVAETMSNLDIKMIVSQLTEEKVETINVNNPEYLKHLNQFITEENLAQVKAWLVLNLLTEAAPYLNYEMQTAPYTSDLSQETETNSEGETTEEIEAQTSLDDEEVTTAGETSLDGEATEPTQEELASYEEANQEQANYLALKEYDQVIGQLFAKRHMSQATQKNVTEMAEKIVEAYKERLNHNTWLSEKTRQGAIEKLDKLTLHIGAPEKLPSIYSQKVVDESKSAYENVRQFNRHIMEDNLSQLGKPVDMTDWGFPAYEVNAFYSPQANAMYFPAGFLQAPFYDDANTVSANYAGIGATIGHEITHAFDSDGALYDAQGNLNNWWTDEDFKVFEEKTQAMITLWEGQPYATGKVNGQLTVTENIADLGGLAVTLDALKKEEKADLRDFFIAHARTWGEVSTDNFYLNQMATDTHAPNELRANIVSAQLNEFHEIFDTKEGDAMYRAPEDRLVIW